MSTPFATHDGVCPLCHRRIKMLKTMPFLRSHGIRPDHHHRIAPVLGSVRPARW